MVRLAADSPRRQRQRRRQLDPGTGRQAAPRAGPGWQYNGPGYPVIEIAIYPDIIRHDAGTGHDARGAGSPHRWFALAVLCVSLLIVTLDNTVLNVALPTLVDKLHASSSDLQWIVDAYVLVFAGLLLVSGSLADRVGRKRTFLAGLAAFAAGSTWAASSSSVGMLIAARASMGIGAALIMPVTLAIITSTFTVPRERQRARVRHEADHRRRHRPHERDRLAVRAGPSGPGGPAVPRGLALLIRGHRIHLGRDPCAGGYDTSGCAQAASRGARRAA